MDLHNLDLARVALSDGIALITLHRPKALNALNRQVLVQLGQSLEALATFESLRAVVLTGEGERAFAAGADLTEMVDLNADEAAGLAGLGHRVFAQLETFPVPVIAAVKGFALGGGCELVLACDLVYAADNAKFGQPEVKLGLIPGFGGCVRLPRRIGMQAAAEWIYTGEVYSAQQAQTLGLVREVLPADLVLARAQEVARKIASRGPLAVRAAKRALVGGAALAPQDASDLERRTFADLFAGTDAHEGMRAFLEKRDPNFRGA
jgi:enoyl-CoA hydratase